MKLPLSQAEENHSKTFFLLNCVLLPRTENQDGHFIVCLQEIEDTQRE